MSKDVLVCRNRALYIYLHFYVIPTLFAYFLACHPYIFLHFYYLASVLFVMLISIVSIRKVLFQVCEVWFLTTWQLTSTENCTHRALNWPSQLYKSWAFIFGLAISKQLNVVPYLHGETIPAVLLLVKVQFYVRTSFIPRPMSVAFGLGMRLHVDMCARRGVAVEFLCCGKH